MSGSASVVGAWGQRWDHYPNLEAAYCCAVGMGLEGRLCGVSWWLERDGLRYALDFGAGRYRLVFGVVVPMR